MITADFSEGDLRRIERWPGMARLFNGICDHCGQRYRTPPCARSDHYRTMIDLGIEAANQPYTSFGCQHPREQQAVIAPSHQKRRHPYDGDRPEWSGYCVIDSCACECHQNEALNEIEEVI